MSDEEMDALLRNYEGNTVPTFEDVQKAAVLMTSIKQAEMEDDLAAMSVKDT